MSDRELLATYVEAWWTSVGDFVDLLEEVPEDEWGTPTDLPGWDVKACASHTAHLESILAGRPEETADVGEPPHVAGLMGLYTEIGVVNRRDRSPADIVEEIRTVTAERHAWLLEHMPEDAAAQPETTFGGVPWNWGTLLRNRPLDVWMHEQDVRRAVGRPGHLDTLGAQHTADYLSEGFGYVVGKRVAPPAGTTAVLDVEGSPTQAVEVDDDGRAQRLSAPPEEPTVGLAMDRGTFIVLAGGRRTVSPDAVTVTGDAALAQQVLANLGTTP
ncbi:maleylpyruvate isomerase family mycothiol-dependent enzyme [Nocardioides panacisoli]|uniref:maleylpyruvate isomerase family mycothiol-dependent enzyme n=1 Tax=Nocardioides panacisoli TaxID=627624 RepID=UPI001C628043|nr:maleylpyruvate isomerase family mycothiol-dependent enzyme [Nocardioides panacisoli]QYJ02952.1 maleylpyruvate isomerase family mycothiol-dependent enzyme [Nocardioides panacisoli]